MQVLISEGEASCHKQKIKPLKVWNKHMFWVRKWGQKTGGDLNQGIWGGLQAGCMLNSEKK